MDVDSSIRNNTLAPWYPGPSSESQPNKTRPKSLNLVVAWLRLRLVLFSAVIFEFDDILVQVFFLRSIVLLPRISPSLPKTLNHEPDLRVSLKDNFENKDLFTKEYLPAYARLIAYVPAPHQLVRQELFLAPVLREWCATLRIAWKRW